MRRFVFRPAGCIFMGVALAVVSYCSCSGERTDKDAGSRSASKETSSKDVLLERVDGAMVRFVSFRGKIVILNFIATWNNDSRDFIPIMNELERKFKDRDVAVIGVTLDKDNSNAVKSFVEKSGAEVPVFINGEAVAGLYGGVKKLPTTYIILRDGSVYQRIEGLKRKKYYEDRVVGLLSHRM